VGSSWEEISMIRADGEISELWISPTGQVGGKIACMPSIRPAPGQYVLATAAPSNPSDWAGEALSTGLFACSGAGGSLLVAPPLPIAWHVGSRLSLRGPCGKGFRFPAGARKVALAALDGNPYRLEGLLQQALLRQAEVTLYCSFIPADLPMAVEILPLDLLPDALKWADFLAIETCLPELPQLPERLKLSAGHASFCPTQVLAASAMPCAGQAECGVCSVRTRRGWRLACQDGPVFDYNLLDLR
jgi:hypothetical protein